MLGRGQNGVIGSVLIDNLDYTLQRRKGRWSSARKVGCGPQMGGARHRKGGKGGLGTKGSPVAERQTAR